MKRFLTGLFIIPLLAVMAVPVPAQAYTFDGNRIIDDSVFNNFGSMDSAQIDTWLNGFANSCISASSGFRAVEPIGYAYAGGFQFGGYVTAGKVIYESAQAYGINPQVLLVTLEKEQSLITGRNNFNTYCNNGEQHKYASAMGYGCPDSGSPNNYTGLNLYQRNGTTVTATGQTCVNAAHKAGFSQQVIRAAWLLKFGQQRSRGNIGWAVIKGNWNNSDDPQSCYGGPTTAGFFARCPSAAATNHDGYYTIDATVVRLESGATAALYWYTPHFHGNQVFYDLYTAWFGSTKSSAMEGCHEATNTTRSCIWYLTSQIGKPYYTSSVSLRQGLVDNENYDYIDKVFYGNVIPHTGNIPVYRLDRDGGSSFLTANLAEYNALDGNGFDGQGVDFYADPGNANSGYPIYRLYLASQQYHRWVASLGERDQLVAQGYAYEGVAFTSISPLRQETVPPTGQNLVYRFSMPTLRHFWTKDVYERDQMIRAGYNYEGVSWRANQASTAAPVYRLYHPGHKIHLNTKDTWEKQVLTSQHGWTDEGVAFYANPSSAGAPVYRVYNPVSREHLFTPDAWERNVLTSQHGWLAEGEAWYQP